MVDVAMQILILGQIQQLFPDAPEITFARWMALGLPLVVLFLPVVCLWVELLGQAWMRPLR